MNRWFFLALTLLLVLAAGCSSAPAERPIGPALVMFYTDN